MDTILLIFALINGPLIFISCVCTIINNFITLYFWCQHHFSKTSPVSMATQVSPSPRVINLEVSCHLEVVNEVSLSMFLTFYYPISMATHQQWLRVFLKCILISLMFTLRACVKVTHLSQKLLKLSQVCVLTFLGNHAIIKETLL